jgi:hypothetical protein
MSSLTPSHSGYLTFEDEFEEQTAGNRSFAEFNSLTCVLSVFKTAEKASFPQEECETEPNCDYICVQHVCRQHC